MVCMFFRLDKKVPFCRVPALLMLLALVLVLLPAHEAHSTQRDGIQRVTSASGKTLQILDTRGEGEDSGLVAASSASKQQYVVLLVRGRDEAIVNGARQALLGLLDIGYEKVGLILTDEAPAQGRTKNSMTILSAGKAAAQVKDAAADNGTQAMIARLVRHVYDKELGIPAGAREAEQKLAALRAEREALAKRQQGIEAERQDIRQRSNSLAEERVFIETLLANKGSPDAFARKSDGRFVNPLPETVIAAYESQVGKRVDRADTAQISSALQARLAQMDGARQKSN